MGSGRGRPRKPTNIKILQGTFRAERESPNEPDFGAIPIPAAPDSLGKSGRAKWDWLMPLLKDAGLLTRVDVAAVETYCRCFDEIARCDADLEHYGSYQPTATGTYKPHPALMDRRSWFLLASRYEREFGMTPSSRSGVVAKKPEKQGVLARKRG